MPLNRSATLQPPIAPPESMDTDNVVTQTQDEEAHTMPGTRVLIFLGPFNFKDVQTGRMASSVPQRAASCTNGKGEITE